MSNILEVKNLKTCFRTLNGLVRAVDGVDFSIGAGEVLGIVGESGSGKSITSLSVMQLLPKPNGYIESGEILFEGKNLIGKSEKELRKIRGNKISMIFQEPMTSLNPVFKIGFQIGEALEIHQGLKGRENRERCLEMLNKVRIPRADKVMEEYPHQLSGGMRQRVMIAMALSCNPKLLIADEPTTALDVTIQAQILELLKELTRTTDTSIMFISHDLGVISEIAHKVIVMYAGRVVEETRISELLTNPRHPYTKGLLASRPSNFNPEQGFSSIPGMVPDYKNMPSGCAFSPRCAYAREQCHINMPDLYEIEKDHRVRCFRILEKEALL